MEKPTKLPGAMWEAELTAEEIRQLAEGLSPLYVRPEKLIYYSPVEYIKPEDRVEKDE
jgi:hypothetical protein